MKNENNTQHTPGPLEVIENRMKERAKNYREYWKLPAETKDGYSLDLVYHSGYTHALADEKEGFFGTPKSDLLKENEHIKANHEVLLKELQERGLRITNLEALNAELLEALKRANKLWPELGLGDDEGNLYGEYAEVGELISTIIAKAEAKTLDVS